MSAASAWLMASRPLTLICSLIPVLVGSAIAASYQRFDALVALVALAGAFGIQIGTNLINDVSDFEKGADTEHRLGPRRVVQAGLLTPSQVKRGVWVAFFGAGLAGLYLTAHAGPAVLLIGVASLLAGAAYTAGPWPLAYVGLGDLFVVLFFGFVAVSGTAFVQMGAVPREAWIASIPVGGLAAAILVVNNLRDRMSDRRAGKWTLVARWGRSFGVAEYAGLIVLSYGAALALSAPLPLLSLPLAGWLLIRVGRDEGRRLNRVLAGTALLLGVFGGLLALSIWRT